MLGIALSNSVLDYTITNENQIDKDWDGEWFARTSENDENWYSEFFIPWNMVPMNKQEGEQRIIGISVSRMIEHLGLGIGYPAVSFQREKFLSVLHQIEVVQSNPSSCLGWIEQPLFDAGLKETFLFEMRLLDTLFLAQDARSFLIR